MLRPTPDPVRPGQTSVWDHPRPPALEPVGERVRVEFGGRVIAESDEALQILETSHPPTVYIPPADVELASLVQSAKQSGCEWKGYAVYYDIEVGEERSVDAAWSYPSPREQYAALKDHVAFYPGRVGACFIGDERVTPQPGGFYGGWITSRVAGPFKGIPGSMGW
ncbi:MAG: DUF427 domain-containing protein [Bacteroidota bacterium]